jgi:hypothetical protein
MGNVEKLCRLLRDYSKRQWKSPLFADSHGRGIFHQAMSVSLIRYSSSSALHSIDSVALSAVFQGRPNGALS